MRTITGEYVFYTEQCNFCKNRNKDGVCCRGEVYEKKFRDFVNDLHTLSNSIEGVWYSISVKCDYFMFDRDEYYHKNPGEYVYQSQG